MKSSESTSDPASESASDAVSSEQVSLCLCGISVSYALTVGCNECDGHDVAYRILPLDCGRECVISLNR
jgi:hypothetical protein